MTSDRDLLKQALHTLEGWANHGEWVWPESALEQAKRNTTESITALRAAIEQAQEPETELETYKRLYELRGKALERPCSNCGHQPAKIKTMAQPEQEPVAWMYTSHYKGDERFITRFQTELTTYKADKVWPLYTTPRQWQGLTDEERIEFRRLGLVGVEIVEAKLKEKNA